MIVHFDFVAVRDSSCLRVMCVAGEMATSVDGMHPTRMHSCLLVHVKTVIIHFDFVTVRNSSCGKVMFLHLSVILFMGGGMHDRGVCMARGHAWQGACVAGVYVAGACMAGGVCGGVVRGRRDSHCKGRYASYWNAFLFTSKNRDRTLQLCLLVKNVIVHFDFVYNLSYLFRIFLC